MGVAAAGCIFLAAPLIPFFVGRGLIESIAAVLWLCLIPIFSGVNQLTGSAVTGPGLQRYQTIAHFSAAAVSFALNL